MPERLRISPQTAWNLLTLVIAVLLAWGTANARVSVLESQQRGIDQRMERIENKIDRLYELQMSERGRP